MQENRTHTYTHIRTHLLLLLLLPTYYYSRTTLPRVDSDSVYITGDLRIHLRGGGRGWYTNLYTYLLYVCIAVIDRVTHYGYMSSYLRSYIYSVYKILIQSEQKKNR